MPLDDGPHPNRDKYPNQRLFVPPDALVGKSLISMLSIKREIRESTRTQSPSGCIGSHSCCQYVGCFAHLAKPVFHLHRCSVVGGGHCSDRRLYRHFWSPGVQSCRNDGRPADTRSVCKPGDWWSLSIQPESDVLWIVAGFVCVGLVLGQCPVFAPPPGIHHIHDPISDYSRGAVYA